MQTTQLLETGYATPKTEQLFYSSTNNYSYRYVYGYVYGYTIYSNIIYYSPKQRSNVLCRPALVYIRRYAIYLYIVYIYIYMYIIHIYIYIQCI